MIRLVCTVAVVVFLATPAHAALLVGNLDGSDLSITPQGLPNILGASQFTLDGTVTPANLDSVVIRLGSITGTGTSTTNLSLWSDDAGEPGTELVSLGSQSAVQNPAPTTPSRRCLPSPSCRTAPTGLS